MKKFRKLLLLLLNLNFIIALIKGVSAGVEHKSILKSLTCNTVIDVGANKGQFSLISYHCFPDAQIYSFEPLPQPAKKFSSIFHNIDNITLYQTAIGPQSGNIIIHVSAKEDSSSLLPISSMQERLFPGTLESRTEIIKAGPLSKYISQDKIISPALLKIDVQGYELETLRGCEELLCQFSYVYVECSFVELYIGQALADEIIVWLQKRDWALSGIYNMTYNCQGRSVQADFLFQNTC
jgi:FkbM family methyltransferase